jgi:hypothetical protein
MDLDSKKGLIKVNWLDIRKHIAKIEPAFTKIVDELNIDRSFPLYLAYYPYGATIADPQHMYIPKNDKEICTLTDPSIPKEIVRDLGYGKDSWAMGMVLEKNIEVFIDLKEENSSIPWLIYKPGTFFPFAKTLSRNSTRTYAPNNILTIVSGTRSTFMLPNIGCLTHHINLQKDYHVQSPPPKLLYEHWHIFKEIVNSNAVNSNWKSCLLYFSEKWVDHLHNDPSWLNLKMYLHELAWHHFEYRRNHIYHDIAFSRIQKKRNLKPNPYLADTAIHLFATALGGAPGYAPACDENSLPLELLQQAFVESYGLKKYYPTIMQPTLFHFETDKLPVYYSLQNPSTFVFSPKSRKLSSTLFELHELEHIMKIFQEEFSKENAICSGTIISEITKKIEFNYYHNESDRHRIIRSSSEIALEDKRYHFVSRKYKVKEATFATDAKFLRGCISIKITS